MLRMGQSGSFHQNHPIIVILYLKVIKYITFSWLNSDLCDLNDKSQVMSIVNIQIINEYNNFPPTQ